jgi:guanylate kinase
VLGEGNIFVLSAPSGTGKSTLIKRLFNDIERLSFSVSYTTRSPRDGEIAGLDYFFVDDPAFDNMLAENAFVEWVRVYEHRYGTGKQWIQDQLNDGLDVLLDIETIGAWRIKEIFPEAILIFLLPPSVQAIADRLKGRGKDTEEQISIRLRQARHEMESWSHYDHFVLNDNLDRAYQDFKAIIVSARTSKKRMERFVQKLVDTF